MKIKKLKRVWSFALAGIMALTLGLFSTDLPSQAGTGDESTPANAKVTKTLRIADGITVPTKTFTFNFTPYSYNGDTTATSSVPAIASQSIDFDGSDPRDSDGAGGTTETVTKTTNDFLNIGNYTSAGVYVYEVTESIPTPVNGESSEAIEDGTLIYSQAVYKLYVTVENGTSGLFISKTATALATNDSGVVVNDTKDDGLNFTNTFTKRGYPNPNGDPALEIKKTVSGALASETLEFNFALDITFSTTATTGDTFRGIIYDNAGSPTGTYYDVIVGDATTTSFTFKLSHNQTLEFEDLPAGTRYVLTESATTGYKPEYDVMENGVTVTGIGSIGSSLSTDARLVGENQNTAKFINTYSDSPETGILVNNLPYILLIAAAILGLIAFVAVKRRREMR
ncbi:MAG: DUF7601 domain-containing protein [Lachnospiraceae bacterium]